MKAIEFHVIGTAPLLMHSDKAADPLSPESKEMAPISKKRVKTEDDHRALAHLEWKAGMYFDATEGPYIPGQNIQKMLILAARSAKQGKAVESAAMVQDNTNRLVYDGPRDLEGLWKRGEEFQDRRSVVVSARRIMRTRPCFRQWELRFTVVFDESRLDEAQIRQFVEYAGRYVGLGDYRPRFGRFVVQE